MTEVDTAKAEAELDRLLNDPEVRLDPARVWALAAQVKKQVTVRPSVPSTASAPSARA